MKPGLTEGIMRMIESNVAAHSNGSAPEEDRTTGNDESDCSSRSDEDGTEDIDSDDESNDSEDESSFKNQVKEMTDWMTDLSSCQQVVSILSFLSCLSTSQRTFIVNHLNHSRLQESDAEHSRRESQANSISFWSHFFQSHPNPGTEQMIDLLLQMLPLVSASANQSQSSLVMLYLHLITSSLNSVTSNPNPASRQMLEKCRELLSFSFICPFFTSDQKKNFLNPFTSKLLMQSSENAYIQSTLRSSMRRGEDPLSESGSAVHVKPFSGIGMATVAPYLKSLRLHKYTPLFASLPSLHHFLNLTDDQLEFLGVAAKGARKKFVQSLAKLKARPDLLKSLFNSRSVADILSVVSEVITTPLSRDSPEVNLILHLLLKAKDEMNAEHEKEFQEVLFKCLQQPIWSREQMRLLLHMKDPSQGMSTPSSPTSSPSARSKLTSTSQSNQLDKQMQNLCLAVTEKALNNV